MGVKFGDTSITDAMVMTVYGMSITATTWELPEKGIAQKYGITREEADEFGLSRAIKSFVCNKSGKFKEEIISVEVQGVIIEKDEGIREDTSLEKLAKLPPVFQKRRNSHCRKQFPTQRWRCGIGSSFGAKSYRTGIKPLAKIIDYATGGTRPEDIMEAPIPTVKKLLGKTGFTINDMDLIEYNEPYASAAIVVSKELEIDPKNST